MGLFLRDATIVGRERVVRGGVRVNRGKIDKVGPDAKAEKSDLVLDLEGKLLFPGLINAHDHLDFNCFPFLGKKTGVYSNSYEWANDLHSKEKNRIIQRVLKIPIERRFLVGGLKNLLSGVTTVSHHEDYNSKILDGSFPVRVLRDYGWCYSVRLGGDVLKSFKNTKKTHPWIVHVAEGTDAEAHEEVAQLTELGCLVENTVLVHGIALTETDIAHMVSVGASMIWCPTSNLRLFGRTAPVAKLKGRVPMALGSDSTMAGSTNLLAELRSAFSLGVVGYKDLFKMVTSDAAQVLRIDDRVGSIEPGKLADLVVMSGFPADPYRSLVESNLSQVRLVLREGRPLYAAQEYGKLFTRARVKTEKFLVADEERLIAADAVSLDPAVLKARELLAQILV